MPAADDGWFSSLTTSEKQAFVDYLVRGLGTPSEDGGSVELPYTDAYPVDASAALQSAMDSMAATGKTYQVQDLATGATDSIDSGQIGEAQDYLYHYAGVWDALDDDWQDRATFTGTDTSDEAVLDQDMLPEAFADPEAGALVAAVVELAPAVYQLVAATGLSSPSSFPSGVSTVTGVDFCENVVDYEQPDNVCSNIYSGDSYAPGDQWADCFQGNTGGVGTADGNSTEGGSDWERAADTSADCDGLWFPANAEETDPAPGYVVWLTSGAADNPDGQCHYGNFAVGSDQGSAACWYAYGFDADGSNVSGCPLYGPGALAVLPTPNPLHTPPGLAWVGLGDALCQQSFEPDTNSASALQYLPPPDTFHVDSGTASTPCAVLGEAEDCGVQVQPSQDLQSSQQDTGTATQGSTIETSVGNVLDSPQPTTPGAQPGSNVPSGGLSLIEWGADQVWSEPAVCDGEDCVANPDVEIPAPYTNELNTHYEARLDTLGLTNVTLQTADETQYDPWLDPDSVIQVQPAPGSEVDPVSDPEVTVTSNPDPDGEPVCGSCTSSAYVPPTTGGIVWPAINTPCNVFPFGVPCWLSNQFSQFVASPEAPVFTLNAGPLGGDITIDLGDIDGFDTSAIMSYGRVVILFLSFGGFLLWLAKRPPEGFSTNDPGEQGELF
ncbi:MAG: hypothetical protein WA317_00610 [Mycobacterium sp.]|uniref:hypothetical protein n=1 Tax=Mycobacterium sp. TaxID=1785 RepID=UPI003CC64187